LKLNWFLVKNSLLVSGAATLLALVFGLAGALWLAGLPSPWRKLFLGGAIIALALPPFVVTNCWLHFLGQTGVWHRWLPLNILSLSGAIWILSLLLWPIPALAVSSAWRRLEPAQLESDLAVTGWHLVRGLLMPLARGALALAGVLSFVLALNNFAVPTILQVKVFPEEMWVRFNTAFDTAGVLRLSWPLVLGPLFLLLWFSRREIPWPHLQPAVPARLFRQQFGPVWFWSCGAATSLICLLSVGLPVWQLISTKRTWTELPGALLAGQSAVWNSLWLAFAAAASILGATLFFRAVSFNRFNRFNSFNTLFGVVLWLPFLLPGVLLGIGLIAAFNHDWSAFLYRSTGIVILAFGIRYIGLGWNAVARACERVDPDLIDVARLEGASRWQMLRHVQWPQIAPAARAAWYIVFLLCLWDVESMILVVPPGGETLALRIFNLLHYGYNAQVNALCLTLLVVALLPLMVWQGWSVARVACCVLRVPFASNTQHATRNMAMLACALLLLTGCSPAPSSNTAPLHSRLFTAVQVIGSRGVGVGQLNKPRSVAVDLHDNLYVVDMTGRVQKFSPSGAFLLSWQMPQTDRGKPKGMSRDHAGNIVVVEPHYSRVNQFSPEGKLVAQWGEHGTNFGQLGMPRAIAFNSRNEAFVSEYQESERVQRFVCSKSGLNELNRSKKLNEGESPVTAPASAVRSVAHPDLTNLTDLTHLTNSARVHCLAIIGKGGTGLGEFNRAEGLCVDAQDRLYVADSCNHRIEVFSSDGTFLRAYGKPGSGLGELSYPYDICVDSAGRQYVCEFGNSRVQVFDASDQPIEIIGGPGLEAGRFNNPWGVALDSEGNLYVADSQNHRVQKLIRGQRAVVRGQGSEVRGQRSEARGQRLVVSSPWSVVSSSPTGNRLTTNHGPRTTDYGLRTTDFGLYLE
jgi:ABC-type Fe3+ transport system permease subunit/DNA-binding beta-propeller fold protein YncE